VQVAHKEQVAKLNPSKKAAFFFWCTRLIPFLRVHGYTRSNPFSASRSIRRSDRIDEMNKVTLQNTKLWRAGVSSNSLPLTRSEVSLVEKPDAPNSLNLFTTSGRSNLLYTIGSKDFPPILEGMAKADIPRWMGEILKVVAQALRDYNEDR
jgi:hypothetical protein